ncbi:hypothetical protein ACLOJK_008956 [Asimina triloba]
MFYGHFRFALPMSHPSNSSAATSGKEDDEDESPSNCLWVGNLSSNTVDNDLMELFAKYGALDSVTSYSSRSYAFIYFKHLDDARAAKEALQGSTLHGNTIRIEFARPVRSPPSRALLGVVLEGISCDFTRGNIGLTARGTLEWLL